ncbi:MAG: sigma-70 family RNA polymerase sigma factor [Planctomycetes bacterium]|nr:sigma-70 family RNA polymerase sigma factor [Planctomycetota bacterium]
MSAPPDPQWLLRHGGFLRSLARGLLRDANDADDVVQDAWLITKNDAPERPWLARVVKNLSLQMLRARGRREYYETRAARPKPAPSAAEVVEAESTRRRILDVVCSLDEPHRSILLLRFWEGCEFDEIARRTATSKETVRSRYKKAIEILRIRLDAEFGGRGTWSAALAPLLTIGLTTSATGVVGPGIITTAGATSTMSTKTIFTAAAAILLAVGMYFAIRPPRGKSETIPFVKDTHANPDNALVNHTPPASATESNKSESGNRVVEPAPPPGRRFARVAGRFFDEQERPVAGVRVFWAEPIKFLNSITGLKPFSRVPAWTTPELRSAGDGSFVFSELLTNEDEIENGARRDFIAYKQGWLQRPFSAVLKVGETTNAGDFAFVPGANVSGIVVDESGRAVDHAAVACIPDLPGDSWYDARVFGPPRIGADSVETDANGHFEILGTICGTVRMVAWKPDTYYAVSPQIKFNAGDDRADLRFVLGPIPAEATIEGELHAPDGTRCSGTIDAFSQDDYMIFMTSDDGTFRHRLEVPGPVTYIATDRDKKFGAARAVQIAAGTRGLILQLTAPRTLEFQITNQFGKNVDGASVCANVDGVLAHSNNNSASSDAPGTYLLTVPTLPFKVEISAERHLNSTVGPFDPAALPGLQKVILTEVAPVRGRVLSADKPVAGASVTLIIYSNEVAAGSREIDGGSMDTLSNITYTDQTGSFNLAPRVETKNIYFAVHGPPVSQTFDLEAFAPREVGPFPYDLQKGCDEIVIYLSLGGSIEGHLIRPPGRGVANILIGATSGDGHPRFLRTDANGYYHFGKLTPGPCEVRVLSRYVTDAGIQYGMQSFNEKFRFPAVCDVRENETTKYDIDLHAGDEQAIDGYINIGNDHFAGAKVELYDSRADSATAEKALGVVDAGGRFHILSKGSDHQYLQVTLTRADGLRTFAGVDVDMYPMGPTPWALECTTGRLEGKLGPGVDAAKAIITYISGGGNLSIHGTVKINADGSFIIDPAPAGRLALHNETTGDKKELRIAEGEATKVILP